MQVLHQQIRLVAGKRARLQGELSVSRSLGDVPYIAKGLTAKPDFSDWIALDDLKPARPQMLVLMSDGVFETLTAEDICSTAAALAAGMPHT